MTVENWKQRALIKITPKGGTGIPASADSRDIQISGGEKDIKAEANLQGGYLVTFVPQTPYELTIDNIQFSTDNYDKLLNAGVLTRVPVRIVITWVDDASITDAEAQTTTETYRNTFSEGYVTSFDKKFSADDGVLIGTLKIKVPVRDKSGAQNNVSIEYSDSGLAAVGAY